jgi:hypothetical protein
LSALFGIRTDYETRVTAHRSIQREGFEDIRTNWGDFAIEIQSFAEIQQIGKIAFGKIPRVLGISIEMRRAMTERDLRMIFGMGLWRARCHQCVSAEFTLRLTCALDKELHMVHTWSFESRAGKSVVSYCGGGDMYAFEGLAGVAYVKTKSIPA